MMRVHVKKTMDAINAFTALICHALLVIITGVTVLQVVLRYAFNQPTSWSEEIALLCLIWFGFLAIAVGIRRHEHVAITFLRDLMPGKAATVLDYMAQVAIIVFMFAVVRYGADLTALMGAQILPASRLPKTLLYGPALFGGSLGCLNAFTNVFLKDVQGVPHETLDAVDGG